MQQLVRVYDRPGACTYVTTPARDVCKGVATRLAVGSRHCFNGPQRCVVANYKDNGTPDVLTVEPNVEVEPAQEPAKQHQQFDWFKCWYPMAIVDELDPAVPHPAQLLAIDMVLWRDNTGTWRAFQDRCPHRLAALSEGRIDDKTGDLYCNYHGWQFGPTGTCTKIPQLREGTAPNPKRSCVASFPTKVSEQLLWVWPDCSLNAVAESEAAAVRHGVGVAHEVEQYGDRGFNSPQFDLLLRGKAVPLARWYQRYCPVSYQAAKENTFNDPSHDNVVHHGIAGLDRQYGADAKIDYFKLDERGFTVTRTFPWNVTATDVCVFPSSMRRNFSDKHPARGAGIAYVTPITTGKCSLITGIVTDPAVITKPTGWKGLWAKLLPRSPLWLEHIKFHSVVDGDLAIQYGCDVNTVHSDGQTYFPATGVDKGMMAFRNWMKTYGNGGPPVSKMKQPTRPEAQLVIPREQLLDRYNQHTKHCKACSGALTNFQKVKTFSQQAAHLLAAGTLAVGVVAAVAAAQAVQAGGAAVQVASQAVQIGSQGSALLVPGWQMLLAVAVLGSASAGAAKLSKWAEGWVAKFVFVDYDHNHVSKMP
eukprot:GHRR01001127.1.p1 GENE.GHRR01001127.1~~GHRR01001127.1.p1  ORF type:complete len:589 (+),score=133.13 GHRR01001127.1:142-1908(+)